MPQIESLFVTRLYRAALGEFGRQIDPRELESSCLVIAEDDEAGQQWCEEHGYPGYTSYASLTDLPWRFPIFGDLVEALDAHVAAITADRSAVAAVQLALPGGGRLVALATRKALDDLRLRLGEPVFALIKSVALDERPIGAVGAR